MSYQRSWLRFILNVAGYDEMPNDQMHRVPLFFNTFRASSMYLKNESILDKVGSS
jgi:hypothetical protein